MKPMTEDFAAATVLPATILVVEDDPFYQKLLKLICRSHGHRVLIAGTANEALELFARQTPDLVLLDIMLPDSLGWQVCDYLLGKTFLPIVFLSSLDGTESIVRGLDAGAVDYVTKPFSHTELMARIEGALRWYRPAPESAKQHTYDDGYLMIDLDAQLVSVRGTPVKLSATEYHLLVHLFENAGHVCSHLGLLRAVWGAAYQEPVHYIHNYIRYLRQRIEPDPQHPQYLLSVRGRGYSFRKRN
jgi:two-component system KDP operon response regulator KdpE